MTRTGRLLALAALAALSSCSSSDGTGPVTVTVSGLVRDYFTGTTVADAGVAVAGASNLSATTSAGGSYTIQGVPSSEALVLIASKSAYRPTRNYAVSALSGVVTADLTVVAVADAQRQYTAVGITPTSGMGIVIVELVDGSGTPRTGIPLADVTLVDGTLSPAGVGPYYFGAGGDIVPQVDLSQSAAFGGRARAAFLNVPVGTHVLRVALGVQTVVAQVAVATGGATLIER